LSLLDGCVREVVGGGLGTLSKLPLIRYMLVNEVAIEAAAWIALLVNARKALSAVKEGT
jgi:hypothetical protein